VPTTPATLKADADVVPVLSEPIHPGLPPLSTTKGSLVIIQQYRGPSSITDTESGLTKPDPASIAFLAYLKRRNLEIATKEDEEAARKVLARPFRLMDIGVDGLSFSLNAESLHRVYSRGSFECNGRAYGAIHQNLPKHMWRYIHINAGPTRSSWTSAPTTGLLEPRMGHPGRHKRLSTTQRYLHQMGDLKAALEMFPRSEKPSGEPSTPPAAETENRMAS
jgi:hypothetical protein